MRWLSGTAQETACRWRPEIDGSITTSDSCFCHRDQPAARPGQDLEDPYGQTRDDLTTRVRLPGDRGRGGVIVSGGGGWCVSE